VKRPLVQKVRAWWWRSVRWPLRRAACDLFGHSPVRVYIHEGGRVDEFYRCLRCTQRVPR